MILTRLRQLLGLTPAFLACSLAGQALYDPAIMPAIMPVPTSMVLSPNAFRIGKSVLLVADPGTELETVRLMQQILHDAGVATIRSEAKLPASLDVPCIVLGLDSKTVVREALERSDATPDTHAEGYTLSSRAVGAGLVTLAGHDADGLFHAVQTFRQLAQRPLLPSLIIHDHPAMTIRGTIEGFYGKPWSTEDRNRHLDFLAKVKANTYVYSPKDDPYARDRWREDYTAKNLAEFQILATTARRDHVNFVYAISPGPTICFSDAGDRQALERKFKALQSVGVESFYVALDDIE